MLGCIKSFCILEPKISGSIFFHDLGTFHQMNGFKSIPNTTNMFKNCDFVELI